MNWIVWLDNWHVSNDKKDKLFVIISTSLWFLWRYRNNVTFSSQTMRQRDIIDNIQLASFSWLKFRGVKNCNWSDWINSPL